MKFSHAIHFNAVPEWLDHYVAYEKLKSKIYTIEKSLVNADAAQDVEESTPFIRPSQDDTNTQFVQELNESLESICRFYSSTETRLVNQFEAAIQEIKDIERTHAWMPGPRSRSMAAGSAYQSPTTVIYDDSGPLSPTAASGRFSFAQPARHSVYEPPSPTDFQGRRRTRTDSDVPPISTGEDTSPIPLADHFAALLWQSRAIKPEKARIKAELTQLYVSLCDLRGFVDLNYTAFNKILKKYEKVTGFKLKRKYLMTFANVAYPFKQETKQSLERTIERVVAAYARICSDANIHLATTELTGHLRERIVLERNTIWRDMIERERRGATVSIVSEGGKSIPGVKSRACFTIPIGEAGLDIPYSLVSFSLCVAVFALLLNTELFSSVEQNHCFALLIFASGLWALEVIPLFVTSLLIPLLVVVLGVLRDPLPGVDGQINYIRLDAKTAAKRIFSDMFSPVIMLLLGGFALAAALSKHGIAKGMASFILAKAGSKPSNVILTSMFLSTFASMWISNVAAPVLCFSLINPILRNLPHRSPYARALIMGIALAANVGGMASPISSPQNIIAVGNMSPSVSWLQWFTIALPICLVTDVVIWLILLVVYEPNATQQTAPPELYKGDDGQSVSSVFSSMLKMTWTQLYICVVTFATICLWCFEHALEGVVGDMGVIAIVPMFAFFGPGILTKEDFNNFLWTVIMLAMGGISLGKAVQSSGLLSEITLAMTPFLSEFSNFECLLALTGIVLVMTTFVSHTVGALIVLPVISQVANSLPDPQPRTFVMAAALMCSGAMGLPVSSFPNMNAISLEDPTGVPWLAVHDFLRVGLVSSCVAYFVIVLLGYSIMSWMGFH